MKHLSFLATILLSGLLILSSCGASNTVKGGGIGAGAGAGVGAGVGAIIGGGKGAAWGAVLVQCLAVQQEPLLETKWTSKKLNLKLLKVLR